MPRAVIFDFDGVIVNSEKQKFKDLNKLLKPFKLSVKKKDFPLMVGKKTHIFLKEYFGSALNDEQINSIREARIKLLLENVDKDSAIPGARKFILELKKMGVRLGIATGTRREIVLKTLDAFGLNKVFDEFVTGEDFTSSKPDPEVYRIAIERLGIPVEGLFAIEDSAAGVSAAKGAGIKCAAITTTQKKSELKHADFVVKSFVELRKKILQARKVADKEMFHVVG